MSINVASYLNIAKFAEIAYAEKEANELAFKGTYTTPQYSRILSVVIQAIQARYNKLPTDPTLQATGEFMYALSGGVNTTPNSIVSTLIFILQPNNTVVTVGMSVTFNALAVNGVAPISYQWQKNGINIGGATSASLTINPVALTDAGSFDCVATDAAGTVITSRIANLVVNAAANAVFAVPVPTDPFPLVSDTYSYTYTQNLAATANIPWNLTDADNNVNWWIFKEPIGDTPKLSYDNGTNLPFADVIPSSVMRAPVVLGGFRYYLTRIQLAYDATQPVTLKTTP